MAAAMRVMILATLVATSAACGFQAPGGTKPEDAGMDVPEGLPGDRDGDGVTDAVDLCPDDADPMQRDHDGDLHGDVCDRCPFLMSTADPDQDNDGVGDACDPEPAMGGDRRALWIGFYPEDAPAIADTTQWTREGTWSIVDGWVRVNANGVDLLRSTVPVVRASAWSRIRFDNAADTQTAAAIVSELVGPTGGATQFYQCALFKTPVRIGARTHVAGQTIDDRETSWSGSVTNGLVVEVASRFAGMYECTYGATTIRSNIGATSGNVELVVQEAIASFDYLFIVEPGR
jgi:hypothetical protein